MGILIIIVAAQSSAQNVLRLNCNKIPAGAPGGGGGMVAGPCHVTDNAEGTTHNEMQAPYPPPGMETTERMNCSGQDCGDKTFRDTPPRPSQVSTSVLSAAEMEKNMGRKKALPSPLPAYPEDGVCRTSRTERAVEGKRGFRRFGFISTKGAGGL